MFWDACDELGLIVWEDFMFACAVYDLTEEFEENITAVSYTHLSAASMEEKRYETDGV